MSLVQLAESLREEADKRKADTVLDMQREATRMLKQLQAEAQKARRPRAAQAEGWSPQPPSLLLETDRLAVTAHTV